MHVLSANASAQETWAPFRPGENIARNVFLDPDLDDVLDTAKGPAAQVVELLREGAAYQADDWEGVAIIGELMSQSATFARLWAHPTPLESAGSIRVQDTAGIWHTFDYEVVRWASDPLVRVLTWLSPTPATSRS